MLETDEVDDDYFTPVSSTTLANIFSKSSINEDTTNVSLKYAAPKQTVSAAKPEEKKNLESQCLFACLVHGYEWVNHSNINKGKLGFAILKNVISEVSNIILYDSKKYTLSTATISPDLELIVKDNMCISYYDNSHKYWSIYARKEQINKIFELSSKSKISDYKNTIPTEFHEQLEDTTCKSEINKSDSDSVNIKSKMSILNRMATMGHAVLPTKPTDTEDMSDFDLFSDTDVSCEKSKLNSKKKKHMKSYSPNNVMPVFKSSNSESPGIADSSLGVNIVTNADNGDINDINLFISEQRINNAELRINVGRLNDKLDSVIDKVRNLESNKANSSNVDVYQKLLTEYEEKIKRYEQKMKNEILNPSIQTDGSTDSVLKYKEQITHLQDVNLSLSDIIGKQETEIKDLKFKVTNKKKITEDSLQRISELEELLRTQNEQINNKVQNEGIGSDNLDIETKIKQIMNNTYQTTALYFKSDESYTGVQIRGILAQIIKKETTETLGS